MMMTEDERNSRFGGNRTTQALIFGAKNMRRSSQIKRHSAKRTDTF
jgi:hypothetical protein